jgi:6-phosphogluconolactonase/glucosamine-6-phosphate isomerase/deaminase
VPGVCGVAPALFARLCLLGIGENGHLAFNDPAEAKFDDSEAVRIVSLDAVCRQQQVAEGWFGSVPEVPKRAITLTIPALIRVPELILSVPGKRKAHIVRRTLEEEIFDRLPRNHPAAPPFGHLVYRPGIGGGIAAALRCPVAVVPVHD